MLNTVYFDGFVYNNLPELSLGLSSLGHYFVTVISKFVLIFTKSEINFELSMTVYDECCNRPLSTESETTTTTTTMEPTTEIVTTMSFTTTGATNSNKTNYVGDGYCDDSYEACQEKRNFWGSITSEQVKNEPK